MGTDAPGFEAKIYLGMGFSFLISIILLAGSFFSLNTLVAENDKLLSVYNRELFLAEKLNSELRSEFALIPVYVLSGHKIILDEFEASRKRFAEVLEELQTLSKNQTQRDMLNEIKMNEAVFTPLPFPVLKYVLKIMISKKAHK